MLITTGQGEVTNKQVLVFCGKMLEDRHQLAHDGVGPEATVVVGVRQGGSECERFKQITKCYPQSSVLLRLRFDMGIAISLTDTLGEMDPNAEEL